MPILNADNIRLYITQKIQKDNRKQQFSDNSRASDASDDFRKTPLVYKVVYVLYNGNGQIYFFYLEYVFQIIGRWAVQQHIFSVRTFFSIPYKPILKKEYSKKLLIFFHLSEEN